MSDAPTAGADSDPRYPIGPFELDSDITPAKYRQWLQQLRQTPQALRQAVEGLSEEQLDTPYREGGWTVRQVVHHMADSHLNGYQRSKLALTETHPRIAPYNEKAWANLPDVEQTPIEVSLQLLAAVHERWVNLLGTLDEDDLTRTYDHPEEGEKTVGGSVQTYAWHGRHHVAHITTLRHRQGWDHHDRE